MTIASLTKSLNQLVKEAVEAKISQREAFTTVDISHPIIALDNSIRHRNVRDIINEMWRNGEFEHAFYVASPVTVYPEPGKPVSARLFHPDEPNFDPNSYTAIQQELVRSNKSGTTTGVKTRGFDITDSDGDNGSNDSTQIVGSTATGGAVRAMCEIQQKDKRLNIPRILLNKAGFAIGTRVKIEQNGNAIIITQTHDGSGEQTVDAEGRIRIQGKSLDALAKTHGQACQVLLVEQHGTKFIQIH